MIQEIQLFFLLAIIILIAHSGAHFARRIFNLPMVFGMLAGGVVLGPSFLNIWDWAVFPDSAWLERFVGVFAGIGVLFLMFNAGLETKIESLLSVGKGAFLTALFGVLSPLLIASYAAYLLGSSLQEALLIGAILTATSVSITAQTLIEMNRHKSRVGVTIFGAAVIDDVLALTVLALVSAFGITHLAGGSDSQSVSTFLTKAATGMTSDLVSPEVLKLIFTITLIGVFALLAALGFRIVAKTTEIAHKVNAQFGASAFALVGLFAASAAAAYIGQMAAITGAFIAGLAFSTTKYRTEIKSHLSPVTYAFFIPIFFISIGLSANIGDIGGNWSFAAAITALAIGSKFIGAGFGAKLGGCTSMESVSIGAGMIPRGEVSLIVAHIGLVSGVIGPHVYAAAIMMVLITTAVTPIFLRLVFKDT